MTSRWVPKPTLEGDEVQLRPFLDSDAGPMATVLADPDVLKLTGSVATSAETVGVSATPDEHIREWYATRAVVEDRLDLAVVDKADRAVVGEVVLNEYDDNAESANFRTLVGPTARGRGLGTDAARLVLGYGFEVIGLHRIELSVYAFNPRARHVYESVGFRVEGVKRDGFRFDHEYVDEIVMSILAPEWQRHQGRPERA